LIANSLSFAYVRPFVNVVINVSVYVNLDVHVVVCVPGGSLEIETNIVVDTYEYVDLCGESFAAASP
jgi:hypothetical protein